VTAIWARGPELAALGPNDVRVVPLTRSASGRPREAVVVVDDTGAVRAYLNECRHLPVPLDGGSREFLDPPSRLLRCGTHGALYRLDDGLCVTGPCRGLALVALETRVVDGLIEVASGDVTAAR
jgi:nitrite reductase/ring-hydroxylating ferredoxin subunit